MIEVGKTYKCLINEIGSARTIHILYVYEAYGNKDYDQIMYRYFGKVKRQWFYDVKPRISLDMYIEKANKK